MASLSLLVQATYSQYCLNPMDADQGEPDYSGGNGLVWVDPKSGTVVVFTGVDTGHIALTYEVAEQAPPLGSEEWDEVVETSATITGDSLFIGGPTIIEELLKAPLPATPGQTRTYRMRVCARGRDQGREAGYIDVDEGDELVEQHRITLWPAPAAPENRIKLTDEVGAQHRAGD